MVTYTTSDLVDAIKLNAHVPQANATFDTLQFLAIADTQMRTRIAPKISSCRENYWLTTKTIPIDASLNQYNIPSKALGNAFTDVKVASGTNLIHLLRQEISDIYSTDYSTFPCYGYFIEDGHIKLLPTSLSGSVIFWYYRIPSKLVPVSSCAQISDIDYVTGDVTVTGLPSSFVGGGDLDIVSQTPGFNVLLKDTTPTSIVGSIITFANVPSDVSIGDYVCLSGQSCVIQAPLEWVEVLVQAVICKIYQIQGYAAKLKIAESDYKIMETNAMGLVSPRTVESAKVINGGGSLLTPQTRGWGLPVRGTP